MTMGGREHDEVYKRVHDRHWADDRHNIRERESGGGRLYLEEDTTARREVDKNGEEAQRQNE